MEQPNILLIVSDQMIASLTGAYGHPVVRTPNLDRLAEEGVRFDAAYTPCPVCSPARACLMSGTYTSTNGVYDNGAEWRSDMPTFAHYLTNAGYDCVLSGKMHFVGPDQLHGFRRRFTTDIYMSDYRWVKEEWLQIKESGGRDTERTMGDRKNYHSKNYIGAGVKVGAWNNALSYDEETHFHALEYLHAVGQQAQSKPFLLCASYHHPHDVFWPPQKYWDIYEGDDIEIPKFPANLDETYNQLDRWLNAYHGVKKHNLRDPDSLYRVRRAYYGLVSYIDDKVGELLAALEENGLAGNTAVIFLSDHGDMLCEKEMVQKRAFYEFSTRVPLIARFPDRSHAGKRIESPVSLVDILPTLCDLAGVEAQFPCEGESLLEPLSDSTKEDRIVFSETHSEAAGTPCFMARRGKYKFVHVHNYDCQLFDLEKDPGEWHNLAGRPVFAEIEADLRASILERFDPDAIASAVLDSLYRRRIVRDAMVTNRTVWDYDPRFDPTKNSLVRYLPGK